MIDDYVLNKPKVIDTMSNQSDAEASKVVSNETDSKDDLSLTLEKGALVEETVTVWNIEKDEHTTTTQYKWVDIEL